MRYGWIAGLAALCAAGPASAATYSVATVGNDSSNGVSAPFRTVQKAASVVRSGDTVVLQQGTYDAGAYFGKLNNITIRGVGDVILDGTNATKYDPDQVDGFDFDRCNNLLIDGIKVRNCPRNGIYAFYSTGLTIRNCEISTNGRTGILVGNISNILIENCSSHDNKGEHGIYLSRSGDHYQVRNNLLFNNMKSGLQINAVQLDNVNPADPGNDAITHDVLVEGNTVFGNNTIGGSAFNLMGVCDSLFVNNLIYNNLGGGMVLWDDEVGPTYGCKNNRIWHNTIVFPTGVGRYGLRFLAGSTGNQVADNVIVCAVANSIDSAEPLQSDYNCFFSAGAVNGGSLAAWTAATGNDAHSFTSNPGLTADYHLAKGSAARDRGYMVYATDKDGRPRPQAAASDLGCYEEDAGTTPPPPPPPSGETAAVIYDDALVSGWTAKKTDANVALAVAAPSPVAQGTRSLGISLAANSSYVKLTGTGLATSGRTTLRLAVYGTPNLQLRSIVDDVQQAKALNLSSYSPTALANGWVEYSIPLADLAATKGKLTGLRISGTKVKGWVYLDSIRMQ